MLVVCWDSGPDAGAPLLQLQLVERLAESPRKSVVKGNSLESMQLLTRADLNGGFHGRVAWSGDGLRGGYWCWQVPAQMVGDKAQPQSLTEVRGAPAEGLYIFFSLVSVLLDLLPFIHQWGWSIAGRELRHLVSSPRDGAGIRSCHLLVCAHTVWLNNNHNFKQHAKSGPCTAGLSIVTQLNAWNNATWWFPFIWVEVVHWPLCLWLVWHHWLKFCWELFSPI